MLRIIKPIFDEIGFEMENETHIQRLHRSTIVHHACFFGYDACVNEAEFIYHRWMENKFKNVYV